MVKQYYRPKIPIEHQGWFQDKKRNIEEMAGRKMTDAEVKIGVLKSQIEKLKGRA